MDLTRFKDLRSGDKIRYQEKKSDGTIVEEGEGAVKGFGTFGFTDLVWIVKKNTGEIKSIPYENITKLETPS